MVGAFILTRALGILHSILRAVTVERLVGLIVRLCAALEVRDIDIGSLMPSVVLGGLIDLIQLFFGWVELASGVLGTVTGDVSENDCGIVDYVQSARFKRN